MNQAALQASRQQQDEVTLTTLEWAKDKILMGAERKKAVITEQDRKVTAYHEGGHALCALFAPGAVPIYKATIVPRGNALGPLEGKTSRGKGLGRIRREREMERWRGGEMESVCVRSTT